MRRRVRGLTAYIEYREIFSHIITPRLVELLFARMPLAATLGQISRISLALNNDSVRAIDPNNQRQLIKDFEAEVPWIRRLGDLMSREQRVLVHSLQMAFMVRLALLHCYTDERLDSDFGDSFVRALLAVNDLYSRTLSTQSNGAGVFVKMELQSLVTFDEGPSQLVYRNARFFEWAAELSADDRDFLPVSDDLKRFRGMNGREFITASFCIFTQFLTIRDANVAGQRGVFSSLRAMCETLSDRTCINNWLSRHALSVDEMRSRLAVVPTTYGIGDLLPFLDRPIVIAEDDVVVCPVPMFLGNVVGTGLFFTLFDAYKAEDEQKSQRFTRMYGRFLEEYCREIVKWATDGLSFSITGDEEYTTRYGPRRATDIIIQCESHPSVFMEVSKKRFNLIATIANGDMASLSKDLDQMIVEKVEQIGKYIRDVESGLSALSQPCSEALPLIITGQAVPGMLGIPRLIRDKLAAVEPFAKVAMAVGGVSYMSVDELESLAKAFGGRLDLAALIRKKHNHPETAARDGSVRNFFYYYYSDSTAREPRELPSQTELFKRTVIETFEKWM